MRNVLLLNLTATVLILTAGALAKSGTVLAQPGLGLPIPQGTPAALIKKIVVSGEVKTETEVNQATLTRGGRTVRIVLPTILYINDVIETFADTQVTVLFFNSPVPTHDNEVIIDAKSKVGISSSDSWWGRAWAKVKDTFTSETRYARLSAKGTEYELDVCTPEHPLTGCTPDRATLVVLEGQILVEKGTYTLAGQSASLAPELIRPEPGSPQFLFANFAPEPAAQQQATRVVDVQAGTKDEFEVTYNIFNECHQRHHFEFRTSERTDWLQLDVEKTWEIAARQRLAVKASLKIDATQLSVGPHDANVYVLCLDCKGEAGCAQAQLDWPYRVNVKTSPTPTPTPTVTPTPSNQVFNVNELQQSVITKGFDTPAAAPDTRVLAVIDWTNTVILITQPSYSSQNIIPHFSTTEQRSQSFRDARPRAILRHEPDSNRILGDVYIDWGQAALAVFAYEKEKNRGPQRLSGNSLIDQGEAYRITGQLDEARKAVPSGAQATSPRALNLSGNIALDEARIALDKGDKNKAGSSLGQALTAFEKALPSPTARQTGSVADNTTIQTNLAETHLVAGDLALEKEDTQGAKASYEAAAQKLASVQQADSIYPFGVTDLGRAYQGSGDAAALMVDIPAATDSYAKAKRQHEQAIAAHRDFAEAYFNLGDLFDDLGDKENAKLNYRLAIQSRPEQPAAYYPLAMLLKDENPQLAAALAATYLQLELEVFKHGKKAENAQRIADHQPVGRTPRPGERINQPTPVPPLLNKTQTDASSAIKAAGFSVGRTESRADPQARDTVIGQSPTAGTTAPRGSAIDLVVSAGPGPGTETGALVPDVLNKPQAEAKTIIESAGLRVGNVAKRNDSRPEGTVLEQRPTAQTRATRGSAIDLIVSAGVEPIEPPVVPNVVGLSQTEATTAIENAGLKVRKIQTRSENKPKNTVIKQSPNAGKTVKRGSSVDLVISEGVDVPGVINNRRDQATREIIKRGLAVGNIEERGSCKLGDVIEQNPAPHARVDPGTPVNLVIGSLGENPVSVPNLIGIRRDEAVAVIRNKELTLGRVQTEETNDAPEGTVVRQSPRAETPFARNCPFRIDLTVAIPSTVGNYVGMSESAARFQISLKGFSPNVEYRQTSDQRDGIVLEQDPQPGTPAARGTVVRLVVSKVPTVPVPNVVTMLLPNAKATLENAQLNLGQVTYEKASSAPIGGTFGFPQSQPCRVTRQDPVGGRQVPRGIAVHLWVIEWLDGNHRQLDCRNYSNDGN